MRITQISHKGFKGLSRKVDVTHRNLLVTGGMGAGKSTLLEAVAITLDLPTRHGQTNMERLSPGSEWSVGLRFDGGPALERIFRRGKCSYYVDSMAVPAAQYKTRVAGITTAEPHHADLGAFLGLSGQKRAELFARLLEAGSETALKDLLRDGFDTWLEAELGTLDGFGDLLAMGEITAPPAGLLMRVKDEQNAYAQRAKDARGRLEHLNQTAAATPRAASLSEAQDSISEIDKTIGDLEGRKRSVEVDQERYTAAGKVLASARSEVDKAKAALKLAEAAVESIPSLEDSLGRARTARDEAAGNASAALSWVDSVQKTRDEAEVELGRVRERLELARKVANLDWNAMVMAEMHTVIEQASPLLKKLVHDTPALQDDLVGLVTGVVTTVLGLPPVWEAREKEAGSALEKAVKAVADRAKTADAAEDIAEKARVAVDDAVAKRAAAVAARDTIDAMRATVATSEEQVRSLEQSAARTAAVESTASLDEQVAALKARRTEWKVQIAAIQKALGIDGQIEAAKLDIARADMAVGVLKRLVELVQDARDQLLRESLAKVMAPFEERFGLLFGPDTRTSHHSEGSGRSTDFGFRVTRRGREVPMDMLSDGETVLTAAAFLSAMQAICGTQGSLLLLHDTGLDDTGMVGALNGLPKLGLDFAAIATSRVEDAGGRDEWQVVRL